MIAPWPGYIAPAAEQSGFLSKNNDGWQTDYDVIMR